jgi:hypothetical protein
VIRLASMAIHQIMREVLSTELSQDEGGFTPVEPTAVHIPVIHMRLQQYEPITPLKSLKVRMLPSSLVLVPPPCFPSDTTSLHIRTRAPDTARGITRPITLASTSRCGELWSESPMSNHSSQ